MKRILILLLLLNNIFGLSLWAQSISEKSVPISQNFNANALGMASYFSINYECSYRSSVNTLLSGQIGLGIASEYDDLVLWVDEARQRSTRDYLTIPAHLTVCLGKGKNYAELGLGATAFLLKDNNYKGLGVYPLLGFRHLPTENNRVVRIFLALPFGDYSDPNFEVSLYPPFLGLSVGFIL